MNSGIQDSIGAVDAKPEQALEPAVLEDQHHRAVGGADRQQVQHDRLDRDRRSSGT